MKRTHAHIVMSGQGICSKLKPAPEFLQFSLPICQNVPLHTGKNTLVVIIFSVF